MLCAENLHLGFQYTDSINVIIKYQRKLDPLLSEYPKALSSGFIVTFIARADGVIPHPIIVLPNDGP